MGNSGGILTPPVKDIRESSSGDAFDSVLRRSIVEGIKLQFQRPTVVILFAPPYSIVEEVAIFLAWKTNFPIIDPLSGNFRERVRNSDCNSGYIIKQYPRTFEEAINLPSYEAKMHHVAIFLTGSYEVGINISPTMD